MPKSKAKKPVLLPGYCYRRYRGTQSETIYYRRREPGKAGVCYVNTHCTTADALAKWHADNVAGPKARGELERVGLGDPLRDHKDAPARDHLEEYIAAKRQESRYAAYPNTVRRELLRLFDGAGVVRLRDLTAERVRKYLAGLTCGAKTKNMTRGYARTFCKWLVTHDRLETNPVDKVKPFRPDPRTAKPPRRRRAMTVPEMAAVVDMAGRYKLMVATEHRGGRPRRDGRPIQYKRPAPVLSADTRAERERRGRELRLIYRTKLLTGIRAGEIRKVKVGYLVRSRDCDYFDLPDYATKNGRRESVPVPPGLAADLKWWVKDTGKKPGDKLFRVPEEVCFTRLHKRILKRAGVAYQTADGFADVHAPRKTINTFLRKKGIPLRLRQRFLRHAAADLATTAYDDERASELRPVVKLLARLDRRLTTESPA